MTIRVSISRDDLVAACAVGALLRSLYQEVARRRVRRTRLRVIEGEGGERSEARGIGVFPWMVFPDGRVEIVTQGIDDQQTGDFVAPAGMTTAVLMTATLMTAAAFWWAFVDALDQGRGENGIGDDADLTTLVNVTLFGGLGLRLGAAGVPGPGPRDDGAPPCAATPSGARRGGGCYDPL